MSGKKSSRDDYLDMSRPAGFGRISQLFGGRWRTARTWVGIVFSLAVGLAVLVVGSVTIGPAVSAAEGHGTHGYFTARFVACHRRSGCEWKGDFARSRGGPATRTDLEYKGHLPSNVHDGLAVPAIDTGAPYEVFQPGNWTGWLSALGLILLGLVWVLVTVVVAMIRATGRAPFLANWQPGRRDGPG
jgi:hypothetical protein